MWQVICDIWYQTPETWHLKRYRLKSTNAKRIIVAHMKEQFCDILVFFAFFVAIYRDMFGILRGYLFLHISWMCKKIVFFHVCSTAHEEKEGKTFGFHLILFRIVIFQIRCEKSSTQTQSDLWNTRPVVQSLTLTFIYLCGKI